MADSLGTEWWRALAPAQTQIECGDARHVIRWEDGSVSLPAHGDAEAERVLGALSGEKAACVAVAEIWDRHSDDLDVLVLGPRHAGDQVPVTWDDAEAGRSDWRGPRTRPRSVPMRPAVGGPSVPTRGPADGVWSRQNELLSLLALGPAFQLRLAATVSAACQATATAGAAATMVAALTGRLAPAVAAWAGIEAGRVTAYPHDGPGWGSLELTGPSAGSLDTGPGLRARLPMDWLARVWAAGLAVVGGHLVVAVQAARWPDARVLALAEPGAAPVVLRVRAVAGQGLGLGMLAVGAHWAITDTG